MLIRKKKYTDFKARLAAAERTAAELQKNMIVLALTLSELRNDETDVLFGFSADIDELKNSLNDFGEIAKEQREAYAEQIRKDIGFQNMMNY